MLQNHVKGDVSSVHYGRYDYLPERRAAMAKWAAYLDLIIAGKFDELETRDNVVPFKKGGGAGGIWSRCGAFRAPGEMAARVAFKSLLPSTEPWRPGCQRSLRLLADQIRAARVTDRVLQSYTLPKAHGGRF